MSRILKITLILLLAVGIILLVAWLRARQASVKQTGAPISFRQFLTSGGNAPTQPNTPVDGGLTSEFTPSETGETTQETAPRVPQGSVAVSTFTSGPLTPSSGGNNNGGSLGGSGSGGSGGGGTGGGSTGGGTTGGGGGSGGTGGGSGGSGGGGTGGGSTGGGGTTPPPACSDDDLNISFTADEISRLNALQVRFQNAAEILHTDEDIAIELANYDNFKAKGAVAIELYNYCVAKTPLITAPPLKTKVATPFWRDATLDQVGYMHGLFQASLPPSLAAFFSSGSVDPRNVATTQRLMQKLFVLNLW